mgnify:CR=1 FL=1
METMTSFRSTHMNGQCVDITLTDMEGNELKMPTCFDDFREIAALKNNDPETEEYRNAAYMCKGDGICRFWRIAYRMVAFLR